MFSSKDNSRGKKIIEAVPLLLAGFVLLAFGSLTACGRKKPVTAAEVTKQTYQPFSELIHIIPDEELDALTLYDIQGDQEPEKINLVAADEEHDCYLYYQEPDGSAFLHFHGKQAFLKEGLFDLWYTPEIWCGDYDGDGQEEAALLLSGAHGSGIAVQRLVIAKEVEGELQLFELEEEEYVKQVEKRVVWEWRPEEEILVCSLDGKQLEESWSLSELFDGLEKDAKQIGTRLEREGLFERVVFEDQVNFEIEEETIVLCIDGGYQLRDIGMKMYEDDSPHLRAEVLFQDGVFTLGEITCQCN